MKRRILLVDDELAILLTLKAILEMNGFEVETADSADNAIKKLSAAEYNMVITDLRMEKETSGFDVIRFAKKLPYNPATAILTAFPTLGNNWQQEGANQLLVKPVGTDELIRQLESMLITHEDSKHKKTKQARAAAAIPRETPKRNGSARKVS
jgi:DNA-binding NtrC family response regulator